jgi:hypothetical protein
MPTHAFTQHGEGPGPPPRRESQVFGDRAQTFPFTVTLDKLRVLGGEFGDRVARGAMFLQLDQDIFWGQGVVAIPTYFVIDRRIRSGEQAVVCLGLRMRVCASRHPRLATHPVHDRATDAT